MSQIQQLCPPHLLAQLPSQLLDFDLRIHRSVLWTQWNHHGTLIVQLHMHFYQVNINKTLEVVHKRNSPFSTSPHRSSKHHSSFAHWPHIEL
ncbi:hypothetical protein L5515_015566 [Caenorhabditis briggsae]|uniref:Uncharacterized protein n=1 Tax=Caenorhabditis briggsae TaxID=6238 RepID=A0AAE9J8X4_CAEBR|nr:hypothetical protein L5515_015565 [Caenorhabditis briggsae]UMM20228.1 hypothetical protein L5515_015566 [Caenorhabditis briggsae]